jgi:hypothetical protein
VATDQSTSALLRGLTEARVEFVVVGMTAGVLLGAPLVTFDLDIVHRRTDENVDRLLAWLLSVGAYHRFDLANRRLPPERKPLLGTGHLNLETALGKLDVLCELGEGEGYDQLLPGCVDATVDGTVVSVLDLPGLIAAKKRADRPKDRVALPVLITLLEERNRTPGT